MNEGWQTVLIASLVLNAVIGFAYRLYRFRKGGALSDVTGQAVLGLLLLGLALGVWQEAGWTRWISLVYGGLYALVVMPLWTLAVLIPLGPRAVDYAFTIVYWTALLVIVVAAVAV